MFIGNRFNKKVDFPDPTHGHSVPGLKPWRTLHDAIGGLNDPGNVIMNFARGEQTEADSSVVAADRIPPFNGHVSLRYEPGETWFLDTYLMFASAQHRLSPLPSARRGERWSADLSVFGLRYSDRIASVLTGVTTSDGRDVVQSHNIESAKIVGVEASLNLMARAKLLVV